MNTFARIFVFLSIISLVHILPVLAQPPVPEAAQERFKAGVAMIAKAGNPDDLRDALTEFEAAAALAPQWPDIHYNLAQLAAETDKPAKAVKEYGLYLGLMPDAADRATVEKEIGRLKESIARKRKVGLPGVSFAAMPDGIWVLRVFPGARIGKTGLQRGDKIVVLEGKSVVGYTLDEFFKAIDASTGESDKMQAHTKERMYSRMAGPVRQGKAAAGGGVQETGPVLTLGVKHPGIDRTAPVFFKKSMFHSNILEIEADEFEAEVLKEGLPVVATFWAEGCQPCHEFIPIVETESLKYAGQIKFVNINVDENKRLAGALSIKGIPTLMVYKGGAAASTHMGRLDKERVDAILQSAASR